MGNRLYVGNLSFSATVDKLRAAFAAHGEVQDVHIATDRDSGQSRGFGFVTMGSPAAAAAAIAQMNGASLDGRNLKVNEAEERRPGGGGGGGGGRGGGGGYGGGGGGGRREGGGESGFRSPYGSGPRGGGGGNGGGGRREGGGGY